MLQELAVSFGRPRIDQTAPSLLARIAVDQIEPLVNPLRERLGVRSDVLLRIADDPRQLLGAAFMISARMVLV
jgi:hypothetical protein